MAGKGTDPEGGHGRDGIDPTQRGVGKRHSKRAQLHPNHSLALVHFNFIFLFRRSPLFLTNIAQLSGAVHFEKTRQT